jgi:hypothetical protein
MELNKCDAKELEARHKLAVKLRAAPPKRPRAGEEYARNIPFPDGLVPVPQRLVSRAGPSRTVVRGLLSEAIAAWPPA